MMVYWHGVIDYGILAWGYRLLYIGMGLSIMVYWHGVIELNEFINLTKQFE